MSLKGIKTQLLIKDMINCDNLQKSLKNLEEQYENLFSLDTNLPEFLQEAMAESVIQRFKICYDCLWKALRKYMQEDLAIVEPPRSPKPLLRVAHENKLLASPIEKWFDYTRMRIGTTHDYSNEKAKECLEMMADFIKDAIELYQTISGKRWTPLQK